MLIQPVDKTHISPACKALYFSKTPTIMLKETEGIFAHEDVSVSRKGIKYIKDKNIPVKLRERFANIPFIKNLARQYETFIWFVESKGSNAYRSWVKISCVDVANKHSFHNYVIAKSDYAQDMATETMFRNIQEEHFIV